MIQISKDTLWKGIIEDLFADFLLYFFPTWAKTQVNFEKPFKFLDKELQALLPDNPKRRYADKLVKVFLKSGREQWFLIHIEVQGYQDKEFAMRMFTYFYRIRDRFGKDITALAIFTDDIPDYQPNKYMYEYLNTRCIYEFTTFKLLAKTEKELNLPNNPFSIVMLTARKASEQKEWSDEQQFAWKRKLVQALKHANYDTPHIRKILNFIRFYVHFKQIQKLNLKSWIHLFNKLFNNEQTWAQRKQFCTR